MSKSGPAPSWNRKAGSGCHSSGPADSISAIAVSGSPPAGTPCSAARSRATSVRRSPTARTSMSGKRQRFRRYSVLMLPAPMIPTPTGPLRSATREAHEQVMADANRVEQVAIGVVELDDAKRRRRRGEDLPNGQPAAPERHLAAGLERAVAVFEVER